MENAGDRPHGPRNHSLSSSTNMCSVQDRPHPSLLVQRVLAFFSSMLDPQPLPTPTPITPARDTRRNECGKVNPMLNETKILVPVKIESIPFFRSTTGSKPDNTPPPFAFEDTELRQNGELTVELVHRTTKMVVPIEIDPILWIPVIGPIWKKVKKLRKFFSKISVSEEIDTPPPMPHEATESREHGEVNKNLTSRTTKIVAPINVDPIEWIPVIGSVWKKVKRCAKFLSKISVTGQIGTNPVHTANAESNDDEAVRTDSAPNTTKCFLPINIDLTWIHIFVPAWKRFFRLVSFSSSTSLDSRENGAGRMASTPNKIKVFIPISIDFTWIPTFASAWKNIRHLAAAVAALSLSVVRKSRIALIIYELKNKRF